VLEAFGTAAVNGVQRYELSSLELYTSRSTRGLVRSLDRLTLRRSTTPHACKKYPAGSLTTLQIVDHLDHVHCGGESIVGCAKKSVECGELSMSHTPVEW
jgi:hypothetical protein